MGVRTRSLHVAASVHTNNMQVKKELEDEDTTEKTRKKRRRSAPLTGVSKLRKAANARERERVRVLNDGIEHLRTLLPRNELNIKPTKTEIIWMAARYISELKDMLDECDSGRSSSSEEDLQHALSDNDIMADMTNLESLMRIDVDELVSFEKEHQILFCENCYEL